MDYNDQGYDNYGGSEKGGGSTSGRKAQRRLLWQSIVWAFLLTGELLLFGFWFWWGVGAHNDPYAPLFNVSLNGAGLPQSQSSDLLGGFYVWLTFDTGLSQVQSEWLCHVHRPCTDLHQV